MNEFIWKAIAVFVIALLICCVWGWISVKLRTRMSFLIIGACSLGALMGMFAPTVLVWWVTQ